MVGVGADWKPMPHDGQKNEPTRTAARQRGHAKAAGAGVGAAENEGMGAAALGDPQFGQNSEEERYGSEQWGHRRGTVHGDLHTGHGTVRPALVS